MQNLLLIWCVPSGTCGPLGAVVSPQAGWLASLLVRLGLAEYQATIEISLWVVTGVAVVAGGYWLFRHWVAARERKATSDPWFLFLELCNAHKLPRSAVSLLRRLVSASELGQPAELFLNRELFQKTASGPEFVSDRPKLKQLGTQLFGEFAK